MPNQLRESLLAIIAGLVLLLFGYALDGSMQTLILTVAGAMFVVVGSVALLHTIISQIRYNL